MKKVPLIIPMLLATIVSFAQTTCTIKGETVKRESKVLLLRKCSEGFRSFMNNPTKISIQKGRFHYSFSYDESEAYELIFEDELNKGNWVPIQFFPTNGSVDFKLYPKDDWKQNTITGGELNAEYERYKTAQSKIFGKRWNELEQLQNDLFEKNEYNSREYNELMDQIREAKSQEDKVPLFQKRDELEKTHARYTEKSKMLFVDPYDSLEKAELLWKYEYIKNNPSIVSYYFIWSDVERTMKQNPLVAQLVTNVFPTYENKFPEHVYTKRIAAQVAGLKTIGVGNKYIDFKAPSLSGDTVQLSHAIQDHVALIDLWGSWCGPCIAKSRLVVPIYEKYKDKGFKIVGVAREFKSTDAVNKRLSKEKFSWTNLIELDDKLNIWNAYGISNGTGLMVLVDKDGTILSIDPKPEELEKILQQKLN